MLTLVDGPEGLAIAQRLLPLDQRRQLRAALHAVPLGRVVKLAQVYEGWAEKSVNQKSELGKAFKYLALRRFFPIIAVLEGVDGRHHTEYRRIQVLGPVEEPPEAEEPAIVPNRL